MKNSGSFNVDTPEASSGFLLWQITTLWQREIKAALEPHGLSHSAFVILASLLWFNEHGIEATQTVILKHTKLDKMTISKSLKQLQKDGFVNRCEHETDTRAKSVTLSDSGKALAKLALKSVECVDRDFFAKLKQDEQKTLNALFGKLKNE